MSHNTLVDRLVGGDDLPAIWTIKMKGGLKYSIWLEGIVCCAISLDYNTLLLSVGPSVCCLKERATQLSWKDVCNIRESVFEGGMKKSEEDVDSKMSIWGVRVA